MTNFTPITVGAAANASVVNAPLAQLDAAITALQAGIGAGGGTANRPWAKIGGLAQPTSSTAVAVTDDITHTGKMVRGATTITSTGADFESRGNMAIGAGNHTMNGNESLAVGSQNQAGSFCIVTGQQNLGEGVNSMTLGSNNSNDGYNALCGGYLNEIDSDSFYSSILTGQGNNVVNATWGAVIAGIGNEINNSDNSSVSCGQSNRVIELSAQTFIGGGQSNTAFGASVDSFIGSGDNNLLDGSNSAIIGGSHNSIVADKAFIGTGDHNTTRGANSAVLAGSTNQILTSTAAADNSIIGGGFTNKIDVGSNSLIGSGQNNFINNSAMSSILGGGTNLIKSAVCAVICGGSLNEIHGESSGAGNGFIGGGSYHYLGGGGGNAIIGGFSNAVQALNATCLNGSYNNVGVNGYQSCVGGSNARASHQDSFVWNSYVNTEFASGASGEFAVTSYGGFRFFTNGARSTGMTMAAGASSWTAVSAAALKGDFRDVEPTSILDRLLSVPVRTYRYKNGEGGLHDLINLGPTAEDWDAAFADLLGKKVIVNVEHGQPVEIPGISEGDKIGVLLAAVQGLYRIVLGRNDRTID